MRSFKQVTAAVILTALFFSIWGCFTGKIQVNGFTIQYLEQKSHETFNEFKALAEKVRGQLCDKGYRVLGLALYQSNDEGKLWVGIIIYEEK